MTYLFVFMGGGAGSLIRYLLQLAIPVSAFPWATLTANVFASLVLAAVSISPIESSWKIFLITGFCGGLSTFSTFSLETVRLAQQGQWLLVLMNILMNVAICMLGIYLIVKK